MHRPLWDIHSVYCTYMYTCTHVHANILCTYHVHMYMCTCVHVHENMCIGTQAKIVDTLNTPHANSTTNIHNIGHSVVQPWELEWWIYMYVCMQHTHTHTHTARPSPVSCCWQCRGSCRHRLSASPGTGSDGHSHVWWTDGGAWRWHTHGGEGTQWQNRGEFPIVVGVYPASDTISPILA